MEEKQEGDHYCMLSHGGMEASVYVSSSSGSRTLGSWNRFLWLQYGKHSFFLQEEQERMSIFMSDPDKLILFPKICWWLNLFSD